MAAFGTLAMKPGRLATEDKAYDPESVGATRAKAEDTLRELAARRIRNSVIRLPPIVHGAGTRFSPGLLPILNGEHYFEVRTGFAAAAPVRANR